MAAANASTAYRAAEINTLSQRDLIVRLYQGAERFLNQAQLAISNKHYEMAHHNCQRAKDIFSELLATLNFDRGGEVANQLKELYLFFLVQIIEANLYKDAARISRLLPIIAGLREAWQQVPDTEANTTSVPEGNQGAGFSVRL
jgi:flagellar protein FliS